MTEYIKNISLFLMISLITNTVCILLESTFIISFLKSNLVIILIALLAINTTTISVIMVKLRELKDNYNLNFDNTTASIKHSIHEQVYLIPISLLVFTLQSSHIIYDKIPYSLFILNSLLICIFFYSLHILHDTANAVFIIINAEENS